MPEKHDEILRRLYLLAEYFDKKLSQTQFVLYTLKLMDLKLEDLDRAIELYCNDPKNSRFPLPLQLKACLYLSDDEQARHAVAKIIAALSRWADSRGDEWRTMQAKREIGKLGWAIVQELGGWSALSRLEDLGPATQAQWRELGKTLLHEAKLIVNDTVDLPAGTPRQVGQTQNSGQKTGQIDDLDPAADERFAGILRRSGDDR